MKAIKNWKLCKLLLQHWKPSTQPQKAQSLINKSHSDEASTNSESQSAHCKTYDHEAALKKYWDMYK